MAAVLCSAGPARFVDVTDAVGLGAEVIPETVSRLCLADLDGDGWPDAVIGPAMVRGVSAGEMCDAPRSFGTASVRLPSTYSSKRRARPS